MRILNPSAWRMGSPSTAATHWGSSACWTRAGTSTPSRPGTRRAASGWTRCEPRMWLPTRPSRRAVQETAVLYGPKWRTSCPCSGSMWRKGHWHRDVPDTLVASWQKARWTPDFDEALRVTSGGAGLVRLPSAPRKPRDLNQPLPPVGGHRNTATGLATNLASAYGGRVRGRIRWGLIPIQYNIVT